MDTGESSEVVADLATTTGASFTAATEIDIVAVFEFTVPSLTRKVNESEPLEFAAGV